MFKDNFTHEVYENGDFVRSYRFHMPEHYDENKKYPVVLFLHGAGERGDDNDLQLLIGIGTALEDPESPLHEAFIIAPQVPREKLWVATPWEVGNYRVDDLEETPYLAMGVDIVRKTMEKYPIDEKKVFVMGISMGGYGSWDTLARHSDLFVGGFICCGGADDTKAEIFKDLKIFTYHGDLDDMVPVTGTRNVVAAIKAARGDKITYREYEGMNHWTWDRAYAEYEDMKALFAD